MPIVYPKFCTDVFHVKSDRALADTERAANFLIGEPSLKQANDLLFSRGKATVSLYPLTLQGG